MLLRMIALSALAVGMLGLADRSVIGQEKKDPKEAPKLKPEDAAKVKKALSELQDFIGVWNLEGTQKEGTKTIAWKEKISWGWKFKDGDVCITADFAEGKGKYFSAGTLRYDLTTKKYILALTGADKTEQVFEGPLKNGELKMERKDAKTGDVFRLTMNTLSDGERFQVKSQKQEGGKGLFSDMYAMNGSKDGLSFAGAKKPECIVSGGAANITVNYNGKTYYVCCTGCRDEFNANPKKYAK